MARAAFATFAAMGLSTANDPPKNASHYITGKVVAQDVPGVRVRVQFPDLDGMPSYLLPVGQKNTQNNKDFYLPDIGEQVVCLFDEFYEDGVVICSIYSTVDTAPAGMTKDKRHTTFSDTATLEYDRNLHVLSHLAEDGALIKYDAVAHELSAVLPGDGQALVQAGNAILNVNGTYPEVLLEAGAATLNVNGGGTPDIDLITSLGTTSLNTIINTINDLITLLKTAVQSGTGIAGTPPLIT